MKKLRILYAGSPLASSFVLKKLIASSKSNNFEVAGVLTNPPSAQGRHKDLIPTICAQVARENGIPVFEPEHLDAQAREDISPLKCDILVCFDYGHIFGPKFLGLFPLGGINLHPSSLPKYRGCTPVPAAILNGDKNLGISVQKISLKTDEGDLLESISIPLDFSETTESLMDGNGNSSVVTDEGFLLLEKILAAASKNENFELPKAVPQSGELSYTPFIKKDDGLVDWNESAEIIDRKLRAYTPWPGIWTKKGETVLKIIKGKPGTLDGNNSGGENKSGTVLPYRKNAGIEILCGNDENGNLTVFVATELQWQGKKAMDYKSFMNGTRDFIGSVLG